MKLAAKTRLLMIGDSITDVGRARPVGQGRGDELGRGYVAIVDAMLNAMYPEASIHVINMGISGNTVRDLKSRWQTDVLDLKPDWLSIMIGINDVWRQFDSPKNKGLILPPEFESTLRELVTKTRPGVQGLVLMTPFYVEADANEPMRAMMDRYGQLVKKVADDHDAIFIDTQAAFNAVLKFQPAMNIAWDKVHPGMTGHMVLALAFLRGVGLAV